MSVFQSMPAFYSQTVISCNGFPLVKTLTLFAMRSEFGQRLREARKYAKMTQEQLTKAVGMTSQGTYSELERTGQGSSFTPAFARVTGVSVDWLASGIGQMLPVGNTSPIKPKKAVPLISWAQAGGWKEVEDLFLAGEADEWEPAYRSSPGDHAFALQVENDSMVNSMGPPSFPPGTIIIVDPDRACDPGDYVVAKDVLTQQATFKKLVYDAGRWYLKPLNPAYPTIEIDDPASRVIGRVIEYRTGGKL